MGGGGGGHSSLPQFSVGLMDTTTSHISSSIMNCSPKIAKIVIISHSQSSVGLMDMIWMPLHLLSKTKDQMSHFNFHCRLDDIEAMKKWPA